jgi:hypothetical protein
MKVSLKTAQCPATPVADETTKDCEAYEPAK